jgi:hypothetical protein
VVEEGAEAVAKRSGAFGIAPGRSGRNRRRADGLDRRLIFA